MASRVLVVLASLTLIVGCLSVWVARQALDTNEWVDTSSALLRDPAIQDETAAYLADQLVSSSAVSDRLQQILPTQLDPLAGPAAGALGELAQRTAKRALESGTFQNLWTEANRITHEQLVDAIKGDKNRAIILDLRPMLGQLAVRVGLGPEAAARIERDGALGRVRILKEESLENTRKVARILRAAAWGFALLALALFVASVYFARNARRAALLRAGFGIALAGLTVLVARRIIGNQVVDALTSGGAAAPAAKATWAIGTGLLKDIAGTLIVLGAVVAAAAWFAGPAKWATTARHFVGPAIRDYPLAAYGAVLALLLILLASGLLPAAGRPLAVLLYVVLAIAGTAALRRQVTAELA